MIAIGKIGIWFAHNSMSITESVAFAQKVETCGYGALWIPEAVGREPEPRDVPCGMLVPLLPCEMVGDFERMPMMLCS